MEWTQIINLLLTNWQYLMIGGSACASCRVSVATKLQSTHNRRKHVTLSRDVWRQPGAPMTLDCYASPWVPCLARGSVTSPLPALCTCLYAARRRGTWTASACVWGQSVSQSSVTAGHSAAAVTACYTLNWQTDHTHAHTKREMERISFMASSSVIHVKWNENENSWNSSW